MLNTRGFTLLELLTALIVFGILCGFGLTYLSASQSKNQLQVVADEIKQAIHYAKIEALVNAHTVTLSPRTQNNDWSDGMLLFVDNQLHHNEPETKLIREWKWRASAVHVHWHGFESSHYLRFSPNLMSRGCNGYFIIENNQSKRIKLVVNRLGRVYVFKR